MNKKSIPLFVASALALMASIGFLLPLMEMYDVKPGDWGPQGVGFEEWHRAWSARRDLYSWVVAGALLLSLALALSGLLLMKKRQPNNSLEWTRN